METGPGAAASLAEDGAAPRVNTEQYSSGAGGWTNLRLGLIYRVFSKGLNRRTPSKSHIFSPCSWLFLPFNMGDFHSGTPETYNILLKKKKKIASSKKVKFQGWLNLANSDFFWFFVHNILSNHANLKCWGSIIKFRKFAV